MGMIRFLGGIAVIIIAVLFWREVVRVYRSSKKEDTLKDVRHRSDEVDVDEDIVLMEDDIDQRRKVLNKINGREEEK